jgi:hypothetical protein
MIRYPHEKNIGSENIVWMDMFNSFINDTTQMKLVRGGEDLLGQINKKILLEAIWTGCWLIESGSSTILK